MENTEVQKNIRKGKMAEIIIRAAVIVGSAFMIYWYLDSRFIAFGSVMGIFIFTVTAGCAVFFEPLKKLVSKLRKTKAGKAAVTVFFIFIGLFVIYTGTALGLMIYGSKKPPEDGATVVVLGCQVKGTAPSHTLRMRLDAAYEYLTAKPEAKAVLSGGKGDDEQISEAQCMYNYLTEKGISPDRLYLEDRSTNTNENISFSEEIIKKNGLREDIAIVTDWYHEYRASIICRRQGYRCGAVSADTPRYLTANLVTREIFALANEVIFRK
ncbi:MAG: YdcF family protein [Clostridia bacterium]|nr:YdcF family protein [Clostridia bacterium]